VSFTCPSVGVCLDEYERGIEREREREIKFNNEVVEEDHHDSLICERLWAVEHL
jgi:hypothetical protein